MIRLFASDMDGTFLDETHNTDAETIAYLKEIRSQGYHFAVATGRNVHGTKRIDGIWEADVYLILLNGALILDVDRNVIFEKPIDPDFIKKLVTAFPNKLFHFVTKDKILTTASKSELEQYCLKRHPASRSKSFEVETFLSQFQYGMDVETILTQPILKINLAEYDEKEYQALDFFLKKHTEAVVNAPFEDHYFEITDHTIDKAQGVEQLATLLHLDLDQVAVFGDGGNDVSMLKYFKHSYAMENGCTKAKEAAREVIGHCRDKAVIKKMNAILASQKI